MIETPNSDYIDIINNRRLIEGAQDNLMSISPMKHEWARNILQRMQDNTWFPHTVNLTDDKACYTSRLTTGEKFLYDKSLAFLSNLDGIQFRNINLNIAKHVTSTEVSLCLSRQSWEEGVHVLSYANMIEAISLNPRDVYTTFLRDGVLAKKNEFILEQSRIIGEEFSARGFALALIANICLEGVYFYTGFLGFYLLARQGKMLGSADMIKYINRDEGETHLDLFKNMLWTMQSERPEIFDEKFWIDAKLLMKQSGLLEMSWGKYTIQGGVQGASDSHYEQYVKHLCNKRSNSCEMPFGDVFDNITENPYEWVESFAQPNSSEANAFERKETNYKVGGGLKW